MDNTEPEETWAHRTQVEGKGQYRAKGNMDTHGAGRRQGTIQSQRQHGHTRHRSKARDNTEPETTWTHTTQVEVKGQYRARGNMDTHDTGRRQTKHTNTILHSKPIRRIYETINKKRQFVGILITFV